MPSALFSDYWFAKAALKIAQISFGAMFAKAWIESVGIVDEKYA
jgi:hypothetical protein